MGVWTFGAADQPSLDRRDPRVIQLARLSFDANAVVHLTDSDALHVLLGVTDLALIASVGSLYAVPLAAAGAAIGSVTLLLPDGYTLHEADEALVAAQADHAAERCTRARRYEQEHDVAVALQRSLLPDELPVVDGLELAGRYNAGGVGLEVGGDWYDAVRRPDGILHLTVGDVAGGGIPAAVLMGQLRNAFRALAYEHTSPARSRGA